MDKVSESKKIQQYLFGFFHHSQHNFIDYLNF